VGGVWYADYLVAGGAMADRLEDFQKFRAELNEEILACGHLA